MNSRFTLAIVLLLSSAPYASTFANDRECKSDLAQMMCDCREANGKLVINSDDAAVFLGYIVGKEIVAELPKCEFDALGRWKKFIKKYILNRLFLNNSINITLDLPSAGQVTVLNTDQFLEVLLVVAHGIIAKDSARRVVTEGVLTLTREEIVAALIWVLDQTNAEAILPDSLTEGRLYQETRNEVARFYVDKAIARVR
ncbi:hypothetical protein BH09DEP1_BH09DEP1_0240 [soil metagenome]